MAQSCEHLSEPVAMTQSLLDRRRALIGNAPLFYEQPVHIVRGEGAILYDADGKRYIDMYNNVPCVGHANPRVAEAMARQLGTLNVHSRYLHEGILDYAERLISLHHDGIESVVFACSGTEASEIALFMARGATGGGRARAHRHDRAARAGRRCGGPRRRGALPDGGARGAPARR